MRIRIYAPNRGFSYKVKNLRLKMLLGSENFQAAREDSWQVFAAAFLKVLFTDLVDIASGNTYS